MASLGKKILSAFVEVDDNKPSEPGKPPETGTYPSASGKLPSPASGEPSASSGQQNAAAQPDSRFTAHFDKLFSEANIPGPDYYEFSRMTGAMQAISDDRSRFYAAFVGLQVQGLDKDRLLSTAGEYLQVLDTDAARFHSTVDATLQEKVKDKQSAAEEKTHRIQTLSQEIGDLQQQIAALQAEIKENEEKIEASTGGYDAESQRRKTAILADMERIKNYIH